MNEDMTALQRSLFNYLRTKEDIILKKTVGFKDGKIIFLLKRNENSLSRQKWSYAHNILDLAKIDPDLEIDLTNEVMMTSLGLKDCMWTTNQDWPATSHTEIGHIHEQLLLSETKYNTKELILIINIITIFHHRNDTQSKEIWTIVSKMYKLSLLLSAKKNSKNF